MNFLAYFAISVVSVKLLLFYEFFKPDLLSFDKLIKYSSFPTINTKDLGDMKYGKSGVTETTTRGIP